MKKLYLIAVFAAFLTSFTMNGQAGCGTLSITNTTATGANITCSGSATFTATASGTGDGVYWYDAATGGNLVYIGASFQTPTLTSTTSYWATEVLYSGGGGSSLPTGYCMPVVLTIGCTGGDNIEDFTLTDAGGVKLIEHLATGCSTDNYGDFTSDATLSANILVAETYNLESTNTYGSNEYLNVWIDYNRNGSFIDPGEEVFVSGQSGGVITGSFTVPAGVQSGPTVMRITNSYANNATSACDGGGSYGETHDYKVTLISVGCESPRVQVTATVNPDPNLGVTNTTATGENITCSGSATFTATASGTGDDVYWFDAATGGNIVHMGATFQTPTITSTTSYWAAEVNVDATSGELSCESPRVQVTATVTGNPNLVINSTTAGTVCGEGSVTLEATASGTGDAIYWYNAASGGDFMGIGSVFQSPSISTTTSFWAAEVVYSGGGGSGLPQGYCTPAVLTSGCGGGDNIEDFTLTDSNGVKLIEHLATGCSLDNYGDFTNDTTLSANMLVGETYDFESTNTYGSNEYLNIWIDYNRNGSFSDPGEEVFVSGVSGGVITGSFTVPASIQSGPTVMRVTDIYGGNASGPCATGGSFGETHDYKVTLINVSCSSPREEVVATVNNVADKEIILPFPYTDTDNTSNFANNYFGGSCGYLDGRDVVYHFQADDNYLLNVELSALSAGESSVFVYKSCDDIGSACIAGETNDFTTDYDFDLTVSNGQDYYIVVSTSENTSALGYTLNITGTVLDCNDYQITGTTPDTITCKGKAVLTATGSGSDLAEFYWFDAATGGNKVHEGATFRTPDLSATKSYWVAEVLPESGATGIVCESPRIEVIATVTTAPDIAIASLPYTDSNNDTGNYGNPYEGAPGTSCNTPENYLNGNDVVYQFTAANTELVDIIMSDLTGFYAGVFVYDDCPGLADTCLAGAVAGPNNNSFEIENFQVTAGEDYYVVVSSWLTPTVGYTLEITPFNCADFLAPSANPVQEFVTNETLGDIEVDPTSLEDGATLNWYDSNGNPLPDTTVLVDGETYCVTQTFNGCESPEFCITMNEIDCSTLAITAAADVTVNCKGSVTLTATGSGTGQGIFWYDAQTDGNLVGTGADFTTPILTSTTSYWVVEAKVAGGVGVGGGLLPTYCIPIFTSSCTSDNVDDFTLMDSSGSKIIEHLGTGCSPNNYGDFTGDSNLTGNLFPGATYDFVVTSNYSSEYFKIWIDLDGNGSFADAGELLFTSSASSSNAPVLGSITIPAATAGSTVLRIRSADFSAPTDACSQDSFGEVHDYKVTLGGGGTILCESPREEVVVTVADAGDVDISHNDLTPTYTTTDNTLAYGDNFDGDPGAGCDGTSVLDGSEVIYKYTADPNNDDILDIELTGINNPNTGMYIYASCSDIGSACLIGGTSQGGGSIFIDDYYVTAGTNFFIVISSEFGSTGYTLTINGIDCATLAGPTTPDPTPLFVFGDDLAGLTVNGNTFNTQYTWYADLADVGDPTKAISDQTALVDGEDYYVTQTVLSCESQALKITPERFHCQDLKVVYAPDYTICAPGGPVQLEAQGSNFGTEIYWYDAPSGGTLLSTGTTYATTVSQTTSFWAINVYLLQDGGVLCGSTPVEVRVTVNEMPTPTPTGTANQDFCEGDTLGDIMLNETNLAWYDAATGGSSLPATTVLQDGATYYATQTVNACESTGRFAVTVSVTPVAAMPTGNINQTFYPGWTLANLTVTGNVLTWYSDSSGDASAVIPESTRLIDQETYYVSQHPSGQCESELLSVTVHRDPNMDTNDPIFDALTYYPNPVRDRLTIRHNVQIESVALFDLLGKQILEKRIGSSKTNLDTAQLQSGVYLLEITIDGKTGIYKLIKE